MSNHTTDARRKWKVKFHEVLRKSPNRPTSLAIAKAVSAQLPEGRSISRALVEKWRANQNTGQALAPKELMIVLALVKVLEEFGVFAYPEGREDKNSLFTLLGYTVRNDEDKIEPSVQETQNELLVLSVAQEAQDLANPDRLVVLVRLSSEALSMYAREGLKGDKTKRLVVRIGWEDSETKK